MRRADGAESERVEVQLVESDGDDDALDSPVSPGADRPGETSGPGAWRRRGRWIAGVVVVAILAVVVSVNVADARSAAARRAALATVPGVVASLDGPLREVWTVPDARFVAEGADVLVVSGSRGSVSGIRPTDGQVLWSRDAPAPGTDEYCFPLGEAWQAAQQRTAQQRVLCQRSAPFDDFGVPQAGVTTSMSLVDTATGQDVQQLTVDGGLMGTTPVDDDVVLVLGDHEGRLGAVRWEPLGGRQLWAYRSAPGLLASVDESTWFVQTTAGTITFGGERPVTLSLESGEEVLETQPSTPSLEERQTYTLPDGATMVWTFDQSVGLQSAEVREPDGSVRFTYSGGAPWWPTVQDGSDPGVLLVQGTVSGPVHGIDAVTGDEIWQAAAMSSFQPLVRMDGVVVAANPGLGIALDLADGSTLWHAPAGGGLAPTVTDGEHVLLSELDGGKTYLVAHDLHEGTEAWRIQLPANTVDVSARAGIVVVESEEGVTGMR